MSMVMHTEWRFIMLQSKTADVVIPLSKENRSA